MLTVGASPLAKFNLSGAVMSLNVRFRAVHILSEILNLTPRSAIDMVLPLLPGDCGARSFHQPGPLTG